jgi:hypothetical protein
MLTGVDGPVALAGPFVAYASVAGAGDTAQTTITTLTLGVKAPPPPLVLGTRAEVPEITDLVATRQGALAWIAQRATEAGTVYEVGRQSAPGPQPEVLTASATVVPHTLQHADGHISWTQDAGRRRAKL